MWHWLTDSLHNQGWFELLLKFNTPLWECVSVCVTLQSHHQNVKIETGRSIKASSHPLPAVTHVVMTILKRCDKQIHSRTMAVWQGLEIKRERWYRVTGTRSRRWHHLFCTLCFSMNHFTPPVCTLQLRPSNTSCRTGVIAPWQNWFLIPINHSYRDMAFFLTWRLPSSLLSLLAGLPLCFTVIVINKTSNVQPLHLSPDFLACILSGLDQ